MMPPNDFNSLPDPLPAPLSDEILIDWVDGIISDEAGNQLAAQAGVSQACEAVLAMRKAAACAARISEPVGSSQYDQLIENDESIPSLPAGVSDGIRSAADLAWSQYQMSLSASSQETFKFPKQSPHGQNLGGPLDTTDTRTVHVAFWRRASTQRFAAAASITLVLGSAGWLALSSASSKDASNSNGPSQGRNAITMKSESSRSDTSLEATLTSSASAKIAGVIPATQPLEDARLALSSASQLAVDTPDAASQVSEMTLTNSTGDIDQETTRVVVDPSRAVELARQGRLLIRVGAVSGSAMPPLDSLDSGSSWHVRDDVSQSLVEAVRPYLTAPEKAIAARVTDHQDGNTGYGPPDPPEGSKVFASMRHVMFGPDAPWNESSATYMIDVANSQDALEVVRSVTQQRFAANVRFEELPKPVGQIDWNGRLSVPVIVESH